MARTASSTRAWSASAKLPLRDPRTPHQVGGDLLRVRNPVSHLGNGDS